MVAYFLEILKISKIHFNPRTLFSPFLEKQGLIIEQLRHNQNKMILACQSFQYIKRGETF